jgi:hypothetical protein
MQHPILRWLWLGVIALGIAGLFAVILVVARTPQLAMFTHLFSVSLVIHVDLSVLVWFLCIGGLGWAALASKYTKPWPYWQGAGFGTVAAATAMIALSPIEPHWEVIKSNYIPVLNNALFLGGLGMLMAGMVIMTLPVLRVTSSAERWSKLTHEETFFASAAITTILALIAFFLSAKLLEPGLPPDVRFEQLFWAGGHILQFTFTLLMMAGWAALLDMLSPKKLSKILIGITALICVGAALKSLWAFAEHPFDSSDFSYFHTRVMIELGGAGAGLLALAVMGRLFVTPIFRAQRAYASTLLASIVLFVAGGVLGLLITGQNVVIPAHYHGAIVGVTLALMGYAYTLLPRYGFPDVASWRLAFWQPILYGIGQLMHIGGLAYSGGYGVLRKTPAGETPNLSPDVQAALGFMGLGGLLAIIGGLLFVIVMIKAYRRRAG